MAIVKTVFTATTLAANEPEVLAFLQANATGYFDSIADADGVISCMVGSVTALALSFSSGSAKTTLSLANGAAVTTYTAANNERFVAGYKTDYGLVLEGSTGQTYIITKTNTNSTAIVAGLHITSGNYAVYSGCIVSSSAWFSPTGSSATSAVSARQGYIINPAAALTTLTPLPFGNSGTYAPNLFVTCFTENGGLTSVRRLVVNDVEYVYDGTFALRA